MRAKIMTAVSLFALLTACTGDNNAASPPGTTTPSTSPSTSQSAPGSAGDGTCPVGEYEVAKITGKAGAKVNGVPIVATSGGGLTLSLTDAGKWTLTGDGAEVTLKADTISVDATVDGSAEGSYAKVGDEYAFTQEGASGKVTLKQAIAGTSSLPMSEVGPALAPGGKATLTCGDNGLKITSESVELELDKAGGSPTSSPTSSSAPSGGGGGTLTISDSAKTRTIPCEGRDVALNGSSNKLTFTGTCGSLKVNGSKNEIAVEGVSEIDVNGSQNTITYSSGDPNVANNGTGNKVTKG